MARGRWEGKGREGRKEEKKCKSRREGRGKEGKKNLWQDIVSSTKLSASLGGGQGLNFIQHCFRIFYSSGHIVNIQQYILVVRNN